MAIRAVRFDLNPALASWSESGVVIKPTDRIPSWSALVGLVGAAFGWARDDARLPRFAAEYAAAIEVLRPGTVIEDYHTVQSPEAEHARRARARTRLDELSVEKQHTTITRREYVADAHYRITLMPLTEVPEVDATAICTALANPVFPLSAGRRSCAIGPLRGTVISGEADDLVVTATHWDQRIATTRTPSLVRERRDLPVGNRQFIARFECVA